MEVIDSEFSRQYQAKKNGELAFVEYSIQERKIFFKGVLALVLQKKYKVVPVCPAAIAFFKRNKEYKEVLSAGIRI